MWLTYFQESKRAFLHGVVAEEGSKEKLEAFTNFCEDAIFEVLIAISGESDVLLSTICLLALAGFNSSAALQVVLPHLSAKGIFDL